MLNFFNKQLEWAKSFMQEPDPAGGTSGKASMKRLIMILITWSYLYSYIKVSLASNLLTDIPLNWAFLFAGFIGLGIADKYVQLKKQNEPPK